MVSTLLEQLVGLEALYGQIAAAGLHLGDRPGQVVGLLPGLCRLAPASGLVALAWPTRSSALVACSTPAAPISSPVTAAAAGSAAAPTLTGRLALLPALTGMAFG